MIFEAFSKLKDSVIPWSSHKNSQISANLLEGAEVGDENSKTPGLEAEMNFLLEDFNPFVDQSLNCIISSEEGGKANPCLAK